MKTYRTTSGPFIEKPFYTLQEIEQTCTEELQNEGLLPSDPQPIRIDRFIEKRFNICPQYEKLLDGCLGYTEFGPKGVKAITIAESLTEENNKTSERRINTTLAHEAGHGLLHAYLFALGQQPRSLFGKGMDSDKPRILCRKDDVPLRNTSYSKPRYDGRWWEYQANLAIGGLLLPRSLVFTALEPFSVKTGLIGSQTLDRTRVDEAVDALTEVFDVNPVVARIRIEALFPAAQAGQLTL